MGSLDTADPVKYSSHQPADFGANFDAEPHPHPQNSRPCHSQAKQHHDPAEQEPLGHIHRHENTFIDMRIHIAMLEKDLEHCRLQKAEAELAVQFLATLNARKALQDETSGQAKETARLTQQLSTALDENAQLRARLEEANKTFLACLEGLTRENDVQRASRIISKNLSTTTSDLAKTESTLLEAEDGEISEIDEHYEMSRDNSHDLNPSLSSNTANGYIYRFTKDVKEVSDHGMQEATEFPPHPTVKPTFSEGPTAGSPQTSESEEYHSLDKNQISVGPESMSTSFHNDLHPSQESAIPANRLLLSCGTTLRSERRPIIGLYNSKAEYDKATSTHTREGGRTDHAFPAFFRYGIRYTPEKSELNSFRTVLIAGLDEASMIQDVLQKVRGGNVIEACLLNTMSITNDKSAMIFFAHEICARSYVDFCKDHAITVRNVRPEIKLVSTPTWPICDGISKLLRQQNATRSIEVKHFPLGISRDHLLQDLCLPHLKMNAIDRMDMVRPTVLEIHFTSVMHASASRGAFAKFRKYRYCSVRWIDDPCAEPLEILLEQAEPPAAVYTIEDEDFSVSQLLGLDVDSSNVDKVGRLSCAMEEENEAILRKGRGLMDDGRPGSEPAKLIANEAAEAGMTAGVDDASVGLPTEKAGPTPGDVVALDEDDSICKFITVMPPEPAVGQVVAQNDDNSTSEPTIPSVVSSFCPSSKVLTSSTSLF